MKPVMPLLAVGLLVLGIAVLWSWFRANETTTAPASALQVEAAGESGGQSSGEPTATPPAAIPAAADAGQGALVRESASPDQTTPFAERVTTFAQGLRGVAVDIAGQPLGSIQVFLLESVRNEPLALAMRLQQGLAIMGPVAETRSAADGTFALGLHLANDKLYELCLLSPRHADTRVGELRILPGEWHDVGAVMMQRGATVRGRVTIEGTNSPVPNALVTVEAGTVFEDVAIRGLPGRDRGLSATVDATGAYEILNAPSRGVVQVTAVAPRFARVIRQNIELTTDRPIVIDFGLPPGLTISGRVVDRDGQPLAGVRVEAWPMQTAAPASLATSRGDGQFDVLGLVVGTYRLRLLGRGFQDQELLDVVAGRNDLRFVLRPRATVMVRVLGPDQRVQRRYQLGIRRFFAGQVSSGGVSSGGVSSGGVSSGPVPAAQATGFPRESAVGLLAELPDQRVRLDGMTDAIAVSGLPTGTFTAEVVAEGFAKTLSTAFEITAETTSLSVDVTLTLGGTLRGQVLDESGQPLADATVETQAEGTLADNPLRRMLSNAAPDKITRRKVTTGPDGMFVLPQLAFAHYQLQIDHQDACRTVVHDLRVDAELERTLPPIRMAMGATVFGRATMNGKTQGQMKVILSTVFEPNAPHETVQAGVRLETVTDASGAYQMPRRVPPGQYELRAAVAGAAEPEAQIFQQLFQLQRSSTTLSVAPGQHQVERHIDLSTDH